MNEKKNLTITVSGTLLYPKKENGVMKYALAITDETMDKLKAIYKQEFPEYDLKFNLEPSMRPRDNLLNIKTKYEVPIYDNEQNKLENVQLYHGADVYASLNIKEYTYMKKKGISAYLTAIILIKNGEPTGVSYDSIMKNVI